MMFVVETFTLKVDKVMSFPCPKLFQELIKKRPDLFKELKSWSVYQHSFGTFGEMIEFSEFDSFEDYQKWMAKIMPDKDFAPLLTAYFDSIVSGSYKMVLVDKLGSWAHK
jgi:hypothetical protein